jgi:RimJ/RimL family protein N-acetyltransferase
MTGVLPPYRSSDRVGGSLYGYGLVLREWTEADLKAMVDLFDDRDIAYRLPVASPFDLAAARQLLEAAHQARTEGNRLQLAITTDGQQPKGEILLNLRTGSIGYMVGAAYRRQGLAVRATRLITTYAHGALGLPRVLLQTEPDNEPSIGVARRAGFSLSEAEPEVVEDKGRRYALSTWTHHTDRTDSVSQSRPRGHPYPR